MDPETLCADTYNFFFNFFYKFFYSFFLQLFAAFYKFFLTVFYTAVEMAGDFSAYYSGGLCIAAHVCPIQKEPSTVTRCRTYYVPGTQSPVGER